MPPGGIVGVIGPNGAGKTTLFRMITGQEKPDKGTIKIGESVHLGYVDQSRDSLDGKKTVWEEISDGNDMILLGKKEMNSRAYCALLQLQGRRPAERRSVRCPAASATACISPRCCARVPTSCCSTSRQTISTSKRFGRSKKHWKISPVAR